MSQKFRFSSKLLILCYFSAINHQMIWIALVPMKRILVLGWVCLQRKSHFSLPVTRTHFRLTFWFSFLYRENEKGWRVSPGHDRVKKTKSRCSLGSIKSRGAPSVRSTKSADIFDKQGTMEILDMYKNMQDSFRLGFLTERMILYMLIESFFCSGKAKRSSWSTQNFISKSRIWRC